MTLIVTIGGAGLGIVFDVERPAGPGETAFADDVSTINGGKASNQAIGAVALGAEAAIITAVGTDVFEPLVTGPLRVHGVDTRAVIVQPDAATMVGAVMVDRAGENRITIAPGALARLTPEQVRTHAPLIAAADVCIISLEIDHGAALEALRLARAAGITTILDPAPAPPQSVSAQVLPLADWVTPNESEAAGLAGLGFDPKAGGGGADADDLEALAEEIVRRGAHAVALTAGPAGVLLARPGQPSAWVPAPTVPVDELVDTVGAGDAFDAAFAVALARGWEPREAAAMACEAGSRICRGRGFVEALDEWHGFEVPVRMGT